MEKTESPLEHQIAQTPIPNEVVQFSTPTLSRMNGPKGQIHASQESIDQAFYHRVDSVYYIGVEM